MGKRRGFGSITKLPSGRHRARYTGPDGAWHNAPTTFTAKVDAEGWLAAERRLVEGEQWTPPRARAEDARRPKAGPITFGTYAAAWIEQRDLKPRTRAHYRALLTNVLAPEFGDTALKDITPAAVRVWHSQACPVRPTLRAHAYSLLRTILATAVADGEVGLNPCSIRGAGNAKRVVKIRPASLAELEKIVTALPPRYRVMALLASWCGLRFGELVELRRGDVDLGAGVLRIRRGAVRVEGEVVIGSPKSDAGRRDVHVPPHLLPALTTHLSDHTGRAVDALLFPARGGGTMAPSTLYTVYYPAREAAGRPDLRWHDLRHTGSVLAAQSGATLAELMGRLGHSTPAAAMRYQHVAEGRDALLAAKLSQMVEGQSQ